MVPPVLVYHSMALPNLKDYCHAAVMKQFDKDYSAKWKDIEMNVAEIPIQSLIGNIKLVKVLQDSIDSISSHAPNTWFDLIKQQKKKGK